MANRFLDTNYYKSPFVRGLKGALKSLYSFIICDCDGAGIWNLDLAAASLYIGFEINMLEFEENFVKKQKAIPIGGDKYFFPDFIEHQYPSGLQYKNTAHKNFIKTLKKYDLVDEELNIKKKGSLKGLDSLIGLGIGNGKGLGLGKEGSGEGKPVKRNPKNFPIASEITELPKTQFHTAILGVKNSEGITINEQKVIDLWENFKGESLTGKQFYADIEAVYTHFQRWIKKQKIHNGLNKFKGGTSANGSSISGTSVIPTDKKYSGTL